MPTLPTFINLVGASPAATILDNLKTAPAAAQKAISEALNANLKTQLEAQLAAMPVLAGLVEKMPALDLAAAKDMTVQTILKNQLDPMVTNDPAMQQAVDAEIAKVPGTASVGVLLQLNTPLQKHPVFQADAQKIPLASVLATSPKLAALPQVEADFVNAQMKYTGSSANFWAQLSANPALAPSIPELQFTLQLNSLTQNNLPLMTTLRAQYPTATSMQGLASLTAANWTALLNTTVNGAAIPIPCSVAGTTRDQQTANYVASLMGQLQEDYPTPFIQQAMAAQPTISVTLVNAVLSANPGLDASKPLPANIQWGTVNPQQGAAAMSVLRQEINAFPTANYQQWLKAPAGTASVFSNPVRTNAANVLATAPPSFDIRTSPINSTTLPGLSSLQPNDLGPVVDYLNSLKRLSRLTVDYQQIYVLQGNGLHSAFAIMRYPQGTFLNNLGEQLGRSEGQVVYVNAASILSQVLTFNLSVQSALNTIGYTSGALGPVYGVSNTGTSGSATINTAAETVQSNLSETVANWSILFGNPSSCQCCGCQSALSAAAYLVDLMDFLQVSSALSAFQARRPDIAYLKLNCENTDTELPYIDLVNEILESYIYYVAMGITAPVNSGTLTLSLPAPANIPPSGVITAINGNKLNTPVSYSLASDGLTLQPASAISSTGASTVTIAGTGLPDASNNTPSDATTPQLDVAPEFTISQVYDPAAGPLANAVYPFSLPFNRPLAAARVYLNQINTSLEEIMRAISAVYTASGASSTAPTPLALASECLGLSPQECSIIDGSTTGTYGWASFYGNWIASYLAVVQKFLNVTGLAYTDLVNLLNTRFLNDDQQIFLVPRQQEEGSSAPPDPCNPSDIIITSENTAQSSVTTFFQEAYPFIRLWKKTGWTMAELDKAIAALGGNINDNLLQALAQLKWLQGVLKLSVVQLLSMFGNIDTDGRRSLYITLFQNKAVNNPVDTAFNLTYLANLASAPAGAQTNALTQSQATYNSPTLSFTGIMTDDQFQQLLTWANGALTPGSSLPVPPNAATLAAENLFNERWSAGTDVASPQPLIKDHLNTILAALQVSAADLMAIAIEAGLAVPVPIINFSGLVQSAQTFTIAPPVITGPGATETINLNVASSGATATLTFGGFPTPGDTIQLFVLSAATSNNSGGVVSTNSVGYAHFTYVVTATDTLDTIASNLFGKITASGLPSQNVTATLTPTGWQTNANLSLANLSALYRHALLAQALNLSVTDLISLKKLTGLNPFSLAASSPVTSPLVQFVKAAQAIAGSKFTVAQLNYLYRALPDVADNLPPQVAAEERLLATMAAGLQKIAAANAYTADPSGALLRKQLAALMPASQVDAVMGLISGNAVYAYIFPAAVSGIPAFTSTQVSCVVTGTVALPGTIGAAHTATLTMTPSTGVAIPVTYNVSTTDTGDTIAAGLAMAVNATAASAAANTPGSPTANLSAASSGSILTIYYTGSACPFLSWSFAAPSGLESVAFQYNLVCAGPMTDSVFSSLNGTTGPSAGPFLTALAFLRNQSQDILSDNLGFLAAVTDNSLPAAPAGLALPANGQVVQDPATGGLLCNGPISNQTQILLTAGTASGTSFATAVNTLYSNTWSSALANLVNFPSGSTAADHYDYVLQALLASLQTTESHNLVKQTLSQSLGVDSATIALLLEGDPTDGVAPLLNSQCQLTAPAPAIDDFLGGLLGVYCSDNQLQTQIAVQIDPGVNLDGSEQTGFGSAQWFGQIAPASSDLYTFNVNIDSAAGQVQLWVNGQLLIDQVNNPSLTTQISLLAGEIYDIQLNFFGATSTPASPAIQLQWSNSKTATTTIAAAAFVPGAGLASARGLSSVPSGGLALTTLVSGGVYASLSLLNRIALLVKTFSMQTADIAYLSANGAQFQGTYTNPASAAVTTAPFDLALLPAVDVTSPVASLDAAAPALFNQWQRLNNLYSLNASLPANSAVTLFDVFQAASNSSTTAPSLLSALVQVTGWDPSNLAYLVGPNGFNLANGFFANELVLVPLSACLALTARIGVLASQLLAWVTPTPLTPGPGDVWPTIAQAQDIQNTVKSKYTDDSWLQVGQSLNDKLRSASRDALVAYLLANANTLKLVLNGQTLITADDLYEFFLIDVQMCSCMQTSRIVQATAAIQLFVQRCLMNLENNNTNPALNVSPNAFDTIAWSWKQNFRVWQANREVLLYPENYIVPTLRDDMTPFFQDLLNNLLQNPLTPDNLAQAYSEYLYDLNDVAQLQICGIYWDKRTVSAAATGATSADNQNTGVVNTLHVFGCDNANPPQYFYRQFLSSDPTRGLACGQWTPWEAVNLNISSNPLVPVVWAGRLFLLWPSFTQNTDPNNQSIPTASGSTPPPTTIDLSVSLNISEYQQGVWSPPQSTADSVAPVAFNPYTSTTNLDYSQFLISSSDTNTVDSQIRLNFGNLGVYVLDSSAAGTNELSNPSFTLNSSGTPAPWTLSPSPDANGMPNMSQIAQQTLQLMGYDQAATLSSEMIGAAPGQIWTASILIPSAQVYFGATPNDQIVPSGQLQLLFFDTFGNQLISPNNTSSQYTPSPLPAPSGQGSEVYSANNLIPESLTVTCTAPANTAYVQMQFIMQPTATGLTGQDSEGLAYAGFQLISPAMIQTISPGQGAFVLSFAPQGNVVSNAEFGSSPIQCPIASGTFNYNWLANQKPSGGPLQFNANQQTILARSKGSYQLTFPQDSLQNLVSSTNTPFPTAPFFYNDALSTYLAVGADSALSATGNGLFFNNHWHPFVAAFIQTLNWSGIPGLLTLANQMQNNDNLPTSVTQGFPALSESGVLKGLEIVTSPSFGLTPGAVAVRGRLFVFDQPVPLSLPNYSPWYLFCDRSGQFYFTPQTPPPPAFPLGTSIGDAFIGSLTNGPLPNFFYEYSPPNANVNSSYPLENVDFSLGGAYSIYNWELFFHIPLLIATQLSQNQQFAQAKTWFEYIFNPTNNSTASIPHCFWNFLPFAIDTEPGRIQDLLALLTYTGSDPNKQAEQQKLLAQISLWTDDPFNPFLIARLRPVAFMKKTVMAYLDNLIAWGDYLFSQNTRESINEATQLYVLADQILGPKPQVVPQPNPALDFTYNDLANELANIESSWNQLEAALAVTPSAIPDPDPTALAGNTSLALTNFCVPANDQLLGYWDTVADRLYKIRHCMNIQGQVEQLALFAPPINPALLVAAAAAGVDLSSVLSDTNAPSPNYRFSVVLQKAVELCSEVRSLGGALLSALEKQDGEALSLLRAAQETKVLQAVLQLKQLQINEANDNLAGLQASLAVTQARQQYYQNLVSSGLSPFETQQLSALNNAQNFQELSQGLDAAAGIAALIPNFTMGMNGPSPVSTVSFGGVDVQAALSASGRVLAMIASRHSFDANMAGIQGGWDRRGNDWVFQAQSAALEIVQINQQIAGGQVRVQIAQTDYNNQNLQIANAQAIQFFLTSKYTNQQLYAWMVSQVSDVYFACYQMAYSLAKRAETCFQFELGLAGSSFIQFGYWDSLKKGLLAGEALYADLKRMDVAFLDQNIRQYEITRNISLLLLDPMALIQLKETGQCLINLPEAFFDMDYPGHYMRRIKSLSLTIPCVTGPYTSVNCTLTLTQNKIRWDNSPASGYSEQAGGNDPRFFYNWASTQSIATSAAQNDSGLFEVNFHDDRYLPFEGAGAISTWSLSMPQTCNAFDFDSVTDIVLNIKYTARDGGASLRTAALQAARMPARPQQSAAQSNAPSLPAQSNLYRYFSMRHEFPNEWYQFLNPVNPAVNGLSTTIKLTQDRFPYSYRGRQITITKIDLYLMLAPAYPPSQNSATTPAADFTALIKLSLNLTPPSATGTSGASAISPVPTFVLDPVFQIPHAINPLTSKAGLGLWTLAVPASTTAPSSSQNLVIVVPNANPAVYLWNTAALKDLLIVCQYQVLGT